MVGALSKGRAMVISRYMASTVGRVNGFRVFRSFRSFRSFRGFRDFVVRFFIFIILFIMT